MNLPRSPLLFLALLAVALAGCRPPLRPPVSPPSPPSPASAVSVLTQHNDSMRTGANLLETQLTPATVAAGMQLLYWRPVDGLLTAQLLYGHGVRINGTMSCSSSGSLESSTKPRNVIYAFTEQNTVFAYDADEERDSGTDRGCIWKRSLPITPNPALPYPAHGMQGGGILSTPVIDDSSGKLYLVYSISNGLWPQDGTGDATPGSPAYQVEFHLAVLDMRSGIVLQDKVVSGSVSSSVPPGHVDFVPPRQNQRAGLLLLPNPRKNGERTIYVAFSSRWREETHNYHGWVVGYDAKTLEPRGVFCSTPDRRDNSEGGGIWQGGGGLGGDEDGNVYFNTGNGLASGNDHGDSIVKLTPTLQEGKYDFTVQAFGAAADDPAHTHDFLVNDVDLGAGGVTIIPDSSRLVSGGKTGVLYLMDRSKMTKVQSFEAFSVNPVNDSNPEDARFRDWGHGPHLHGAWTYWAVSPTKGYIYHWAEKDYLRRFDYDRTTGQINPASVVTGDVLAKPYPVMPGGLISLSANGTKDGTLWATLPWDNGVGRIMAFDALTLHRLWDTMAPAGAWASHNAPPTVADGKVIVGTQQGVMVYALSSPPAVAPKSHAVPSPRAAIQPTSSAPPEQILPKVADPSPWIHEYLGRLPDKGAVLTPPKGNRPLFLANGAASRPTGEVSPYCYKGLDRGSLTYQVKQVESAASSQWVLVEVGGELCDDTGVMPHMAYRGLGQVLATAQPGLAWQIRDGGVVHWSVEASVNAPQSADAPWVLFRSAPSAGHGLLDQVTYVQLLGTVGGAPPASVGQIGDQVKVPYTGRYVFYVRDVGTQSTPIPSH
jgi:Protein of unknown function (DUF3455)